MFDQQAINETLRNFYQNNSAGTSRITTEKIQDSVCIINMSLQFISQKIKAALRLGTLREVSKYRVFSGPYFPAFGLNTERYRVSVRMRENTDQKKLRISIWTLFTQCTFQQKQITTKTY